MSKMKNIPICDLRNHTDIAVIRDIESIENVAMVILPKDAPTEVLQALHSIPMKNVASVVSLDASDRIQIVNGVSELGNTDLGTDGNTVVVVNGITVVNDFNHFWEHHLPFGGMASNESGTGRIGGRYMLEFMSDLKTIAFNIGSPSI